LTLTLDYVNADGVTVFHGGPVTVTAVPTGTGQEPPPPFQVPVLYTGPGAAAVSVRISPKAVTVFAGDPISFTAQAFDASNAVVPATPIFFTVTDGPATVNLNGSGTAGATRGTAHVVAQLITLQTDVATLTVSLRASALALVSGSAQVGMVGSVLGAPVVVRVTATDGVGVGGVSVSFATGSGGSVGSASVVTDASGNASTTWMLGPTQGPQALTVSAGSLTGSPLTVTATATPKPATKLVFTSVPTTTPAATGFGVTVTAQDVDGTPVPTFTGVVALALTSAPAGGGLAGSTTATAVAGVATFSGLTLNLAGTGYVLTASSGALTNAVSGSITATAGPATNFIFTTGPANIVAGQVMPPVVVTAKDVNGNVATAFTGTIIVTLGSNPGGGMLSGSTSAAAVAGVATFSGLSVNRPGVGYTLFAGATGIGGVMSGAFTVAVGPPASCVLVSGNTQTAAVNTTLAPIVVAVRDAPGNPLPHAGVTAAVTFGGGSLTAASTITNAQGQASFVWMTGPTAGPQQLTISCAGVAARLIVSATATGSGSQGSMLVFGGNNQFAVANTTVLTPPSVIVRDGMGSPVSGVAVTFTPSAGSTISGPATVATGSNGIAAVGGWTLGTAGSFTLTASAPGYTSVVFTGTVNTVPMSVTSAEKLPNGTQQFSVTGGNPGDTYTWTVNGVTGGNSTFGTITSTGFYTAPATPPTPPTFAVCAQSVQTPANKGCINVTITTTPSAGGELIVINDINWADIGLTKSGGIYNYPGNAQFVQNLVGFTPTGVRSSASKVLMLLDAGYQNQNGMYASFSGDWSEVGNIITGAGYTTAQTTLHSDLINIPSDVKVLILMMPGNAFTTSETNGLKTFASQGGRILFIGENGGYYAYGLAVEDAFLASMGGLMTNTGSCDAPGVIVNSVPHQLTAGISASGAGGFYMNCVSDINLGPNDFALMTYGSSVVAAIAKINLTLTPTVAASQQAPNLGEVRVQNLIAPLGTAGWTSTGPPLPRRP
jgi:hypothetical protein